MTGPARRGTNELNSLDQDRLETHPVGVPYSIHCQTLVDRKKLDTAGQLQKINCDANEMLDLLMRWSRGDGEALQILESTASGGVRAGDSQGEKFVYRFKDPRELALKVMQEIRGQLKLQFEIFKAISDMEAVQQFQSEVRTTGNLSNET